MKSFHQKLAIAFFCVTLFFAALFASKQLQKPEKAVIPEAKPAAPISVPAAPEKPKALNPHHKVLGLSVQGRQIESYMFGDGKTLLVFAGGIHGGYEWNSVLLAYELIDYLKLNQESIPKNLTVAIIPAINPDGVFKITGKEGRFTAADVPAGFSEAGRFNARGVDLNRNFDCNWKPESAWQSKTVSGGTASFSEPESAAFKKFVAENKPAAVIFWHSKSGTVYGSSCGKEMLDKTINIMNAYSKAAGYGAAQTFSQYAVSGDATDWLASIGIPAITVELSTHETIEWEKNLAGIQALFKYFDSEK